MRARRCTVSRAPSSTQAADAPSGRFNAGPTPRTLEVVRQLRLVLELDRSHGLTIEELAAVGECTTRTIRRDLKALEAAGFPLYDEREDGQPVHWRLLSNPLAGIGTSFRLTELCALYFSRALLESAARPPFDSELASALARIEAGLPDGMRASSTPSRACSRPSRPAAS